MRSAQIFATERKNRNSNGGQYFYNCVISAGCHIGTPRAEIGDKITALQSGGAGSANRRSMDGGLIVFST